MRSLLVLIDGLGDEPIACWHGKTPFQQAEHINIDYLLRYGISAEVSICEDDLVPESCSCILRLLGVTNKFIPQSRSYLELLAHNRDISEFEMVMRCNLIAVTDDGKMAAFNGAGLSSADLQQATSVCDNLFKDVEFIHLSDYRNLLILNREQSVLDCAVPPPHENVGGNVDELLAEIMTKSLSVRYFLRSAEEKLQKFSHDGMHYRLYPWGAADRCLLPSFYQLHHLQGAAVCKAEIVAGIAKALDMQLVTPEHATGDIDTDVAAKAAAALDLLQQHDFVIAHFNGSDEASHRYDAEGKKSFIERIDRDFIGKVIQNYSEPLKIVICGDHVTSSVNGKHGRGTVPVVAAVLNGNKEIKINNYHDILNFLMRESD